MITESGAEYAYFRHAFGPLPAFIFCWVCTLVLKPSQLAIICLAFAKYTVEAFVTECEPPVYIIQLLCAAVIGIHLFHIISVFVLRMDMTRAHAQICITVERQHVFVSFFCRSIFVSLFTIHLLSRA